MKQTLKNIAKEGALLFAVGVLVATIMPLFGSDGLGFLPESFKELAVKHAKIATGLVFGSFGAIHAAIKPLADKLFNEEAPSPVAKTAEKNKSEEPQVNIYIDSAAPELSPKQAQEKYQQFIVAERNVSATEAARVIRF